jgi:transcriptional regulator with XRE-family HTH domain
MRMSKFMREILDKAKKTDEFWMDSAKLDFALELERQRRASGKSYKDIAKALDTSAAYVSKIFRGDANLTIESMVKLSRNLGCNLYLNLKQISEDKETIKVIANKLAQDDMQGLKFDGNQSTTRVMNRHKTALHLQDAA